MKGIFIAYDQAYNMEIADALEALGVKGFTMWQDIAGRGTQTGLPHLGQFIASPPKRDSHNNGIIQIITYSKKYCNLFVQIVWQKL